MRLCLYFISCCLCWVPLSLIAQDESDGFYHWLDDQAATVPVVRIDIADSLLPADKVTYLDAMIAVEGNGVIPSVSAVPVKIKGRGNSSWKKRPGAKNPYRLRFPRKQNLLGVGKGKNWVLLANNRRGSMLTNAVALYLASLVDAPFANHIVPVELYLNGKYWGSYNLTEKVGISANSVRVGDEMAATMLELDSYFDADDKFLSQPYSLPVNVKFPDFQNDSTLLAIEDIQDDLQQFLQRLALQEDVSDLVDYVSLARFFLVQELTDNTEMWKPRSVYLFHEDVLGHQAKWVFAPLWDFDWAFGRNKNNDTFFKDSPAHDFWSREYSSLHEFWWSLRFSTLGFYEVYHKVWSDFMDSRLERLLRFCGRYQQFVSTSLSHDSQTRNDPTDYGAQAQDAARWLEQRARSVYEKLTKGDIFWKDITGTDSVSVFSLQGICLFQNVQRRNIRKLLDKGMYVINGKLQLVR